MTVAADDNPYGGWPAELQARILAVQGNWTDDDRLARERVTIEAERKPKPAKPKRRKRR